MRRVIVPPLPPHDIAAFAISFSSSLSSELLMHGVGARLEYYAFDFSGLFPDILARAAVERGLREFTLIFIAGATGCAPSTRLMVTPEIYR